MDADRRWHSGTKILELGGLLLQKMPLREIAHPELVKLSSSTRKTVRLCVLGHDEIVYINKVEVFRSLPMLSRIGSRSPAYCPTARKDCIWVLGCNNGNIPREETPLLRLIRGEADDGGSWVGSHEYKLEVEANDPQHALGVARCSNAENVQGFLVRVKLFAESGATGYEIATRIPGWKQYAAQLRR